MVLESGLKWFPLASGLQEGIDPRTAAPGTIELLENLYWNKDGKLELRAGTVALSKNIAGGGSISSALRLGARGNEVLLTDGQNWFSYTTAGTWVNTGSIPETLVLWRPLLDTVNGVRSSDIGYLGGVSRIVHAWVTGDPTGEGAGGVTSPDYTGTVFLEVLDGKTGVRTTDSSPIYQSGSPDTGANYVRVVTNGANATETQGYAVLWNHTAAIRLSLDGGAFVQPSSLTSGQQGGIENTTAFDALDLGDGTFVVAYANSNISGAIYLRRFDYTGTLLTSGSVTGETNTTGMSSISLCGSVAAGVLCIGYSWDYNGSTQKFRFATANPTTLAQVLAPTDIYVGTSNTFRTNVAIEMEDATHVAYLAEGGDPLSGAASWKVTISSGAAVNQHLALTQRILSRPFVINGKVYAYLGESNGSSLSVSGDELQFPGANSYLVELRTDTNPPATYPPRYVGRVETLIGGLWGLGTCCNVPRVLATSEHLCAIPFVDDDRVVARSWRQGLHLVSTSVGVAQTSIELLDQPRDLWGTIEMQGESYLSGSLLMVYDSRRPFDYGFPCSYPPASGGPLSTGGHMSDGTYQYAFVPEFRSAAGILHRGPDSEPAFFVLSAGTSVQRVSVTPIPQVEAWKGLDTTLNGPSNEALRVNLAVYRTEAGGSDLHRLTFQPNFAVAYNDPTQFVAFLDTSADADIDHAGGADVVSLNSRPLIYTAEELEEFAPPSNTFVHFHKNRIFLIAGDRRTIWYSKDFTENEGTAPGFHPTLVLNFDQDLVGMATMDDKLVVFSSESIWYVIGDGPNSQGDASDYQPTKVQTDVGAINPRSFVSMPAGIMFQSSRGLYIITRSLEIEWIGKSVRDTLAAYPVITSATLLHSLNQVRFTCNTTDGTSGIVIVFDHVRGQWMRFRYSDGASVSSTPIADAMTLGDTWYFVTPGGQVYKEDATVNTDAGQFVPFDVMTAEIFADGPLGYQRVRRAYILGDSLTDCTLTLQLYVNGRSVPDQSRSWSANELYTLKSANVGIHVKTQKNSSFRFRVTSGAPVGLGTAVGNGTSVTLSAFGFEIGTKKGMDKRPVLARK
jgi:hypothetical protein